MSNMGELYEKMKAALKYFDLSFHEMHLVSFDIKGSEIIFYYQGNTIRIKIDG